MNRHRVPCGQNNPQQQRRQLQGRNRNNP